MWQAPSIRIKWGPYFESDPGEKKQTIDLAQAARGKGSGLIGADPLITRRQAVELIAPIVGIENVDAAMAALETEDAAAAKKAADAQSTENEQVAHLHRLASSLTDGNATKPERTGATGGEDSQASGSVLSGGAGSASQEA